MLCKVKSDLKIDRKKEGYKEVFFPSEPPCCEMTIALEGG